MWSHLLKKSLIENLIFCAVLVVNNVTTLGDIGKWLTLFQLFRNIDISKVSSISATYVGMLDF